MPNQETQKNLAEALISLADEGKKIPLIRNLFCVHRGLLISPQGASMRCNCISWLYRNCLNKIENKEEHFPREVRQNVITFQLLRCAFNFVSFPQTTLSAEVDMVTTGQCCICSCFLALMLQYKLRTCVFWKVYWSLTLSQILYVYTFFQGILRCGSTSEEAAHWQVFQTLGQSWWDEFGGGRFLLSFSAF